MPLLIADIRLDERVGDPRLHSVQGTFKVSGLDVLGFDVLLQGREGGLSAYCCYLGQETDTEIQLSASERHTEAREAATVSQAADRLLWQTGEGTRSSHFISLRYNNTHKLNIISASTEICAHEPREAGNPR